jgi:hypothetical protein
LKTDESHNADEIESALETLGLIGTSKSFHHSLLKST